MVDRDGRFLYMNRAFARAAGLAEGRMPRYPGDLVVGEDKGPIADMIRRHSSGQPVGGDLSIRLDGQGDEPVSMRVVGEIGRAHVCTPVPTAHIGCRLLLETKQH